MSERRRFLAALDRYPRWDFPFPGNAAERTSDQRDKNLAHLLAIKSDRIACLGGVFLELGPIIAALSRADGPPEPALTALDGWWQAHMPLVERPRIRPPLGRLLNLSPRKSAYVPAELDLLSTPRERSPNRGLSCVLGDMAIVLGEAVAIRNDDFQWAVNDSEADRRRQLPQWGRPVVFRPQRRTSAPISLDFFYTLARAYKETAEGLAFTTLTQGVYMSSFPGWQVANLVNGFVTNDRYHEPA